MNCMKTRQEQEQEQEQEGSENVGQYSDHNNADIVNNKRPLPSTDIANNATVTPITPTTTPFAILFFIIFFSIQNASVTNHLNGVMGLYIC
ncbi:hypothetical protein PS6_011737 [Mucor atramentarius]